MAREEEIAAGEEGRGRERKMDGTRVTMTRDVSRADGVAFPARNQPATTEGKVGITW